MDWDLAGRVALITGASRGFGLAVARQLAEAGCDLAICARGPEALHNATAEIQAAGRGQVLAKAVDVTDPAAMAEWVGDVTATLGPIDLCLVNAGGPPAGDFWATDQKSWDSAFRQTVASAVHLCGLVLPDMKERGYGRIVAITSVAARQPIPNLVLSNVLRPAVLALVKNLAVDAAAAGVTVNAVAPGFHLTSAVERLISKKMETENLTRQEVLEEWEREIPAGRLGRPEELASLIVFLMSGAAGYITGQCIVADGGWARGTF